MNFLKLPVQFKVLAIGSAEVIWGITPGNKIQRLNQHHARTAPGGLPYSTLYWQTIPGPKGVKSFKTLDCAEDGTVYLLDGKNKCYRYQEDGSNKAGWTSITAFDGMEDISVGSASQVYGIQTSPGYQSAVVLFKYLGENRLVQVGAVSQSKHGQLSVAADGTVLIGVQHYKLDLHFIAKAWMPFQIESYGLISDATLVSVGAADSIFYVNKAGKLMEYFGEGKGYPVNPRYRHKLKKNKVPAGGSPYIFPKVTGTIKSLNTGNALRLALTIQNKDGSYTNYISLPPEHGPFTPHKGLLEIPKAKS